MFITEYVLFRSKSATGYHVKQASGLQNSFQQF